MGDTLILAPTVPVGEKYAIANGIPRRDVAAPRATTRLRGRDFSKIVVVGDVKLTPAQANDILPSFLKTPYRTDVVSKIKPLVNHD